MLDSNETAIKKHSGQQKYKKNKFLSFHTSWTAVNHGNVMADERGEVHYTFADSLAPYFLLIFSPIFVIFCLFGIFYTYFTTEVRKYWYLCFVEEKCKLKYNICKALPAKLGTDRLLRAGLQRGYNFKTSPFLRGKFFTYKKREGGQILWQQALGFQILW